MRAATAGMFSQRGSATIERTSIGTANSHTRKYPAPEQQAGGFEIVRLATFRNSPNTIVVTKGEDNRDYIPGNCSQLWIGSRNVATVRDHMTDGCVTQSVNL